MENEIEREGDGESIDSASVTDDSNISRPSNYLSLLSCSSPSSILSSRTGNAPERSFFTIVDTNISHDAEVEIILNEWVKIFNENPRIGTIKLFTVIIKCFDVNVSDSAFTDFNSNVMYARMLNCFRTQANTGSLLTPETIKRSTDVQKTLSFFTLIYRYHYNLFFFNTTHKKYFIFLRDIIIKISQSEFIGPRYLATHFGLKIITGLTQSHNLEHVHNDLNILLNEFLIKRLKDTTWIVRESVLIELELWINIDSNYYLNGFWMQIYLALGDPTTSVQNLALKISKTVLIMHCDFANVNLLINEILHVLGNLLLSKHEEIAISAIDLCSILSNFSIDEIDEEQYSKMKHVESIALELMFSEKFNVAHFAAKYFVNKLVYPEDNLFEQLKVILIVLRGILPYMRSIAFSFFVDAIFDLCPILSDSKLISQILTLNNFVDDVDKYNLMTLFMYAIKQQITGTRLDHKIICMGDQHDAIQLHINTTKKKEFTAYIIMHLLTQLKECEQPTHAFSLWVLLQFIDFNMLKDKMITPDVFIHVSSFYRDWNIPTILDLVSKCIHIMFDLEGYERKLCLKCIRDIAQVNINILIAAIENSIETISMLDQINALIKIWCLAKYNHIPDDLEPLKYLSYYVPNLNTAQTHLVVSEYGLNAYMEVLRRKLKIPTNLDNCISIELSENPIGNTFFSFLDAMLIILNNYDTQVIHICETAFMIVVDLLRIKYKINKTNFILNDNQMKMLTNFIFCICKNCENNNDSNTSKLIEVYIQLIHDGLIDIKNLITLLQFVKMELVEHTLRPIFNFFCNKETGQQLSNVINIYLVYMFENILSQKAEFKNSTIKTLINEANIISRLLGQCVDSVGKRLVSTNIHRHGIQYAMSDTLNNQFSDYPFKLFFWVLAFMSNTLIAFDAQRLAEFFLKKPAVQELITNGNDHVLRYLYKLEEIYNDENVSFSDAA